MQATAISSANRVNNSKKDIRPMGEVEVASHTTHEQRKINRWPANRLAPSRNPRVKGCMQSLMSSIITIRGTR